MFFNITQIKLLLASLFFGGALGEPSSMPLLPQDAVCGDGRLSPEEQCDDGNKEDGDGCSSACLEEDECGE